MVTFDGSVPKSLQTFAKKRPTIVAQVTGKGIMYEDQYDVSYRSGWKSGSDALGAVHSDSAPTIQELMSRIRSAIQCDCEDCNFRVKS